MLLPMPTRIDSADPASSVRVPALDGIRGLAICLVLSCHGFFSLLWNLPNHPYAARLVALGRFTWSGVDLFFVLSGFLIGGILLDASGAERYFAPFYIRRAHRILPLYGIVLVLVFSGTYLCRHFGETGLWSEQHIPLLYYPTFLQNFWMARHGWGGSDTLGVTWSLAVEEQFYLTLPLIIRYVSRRRLWWIVSGMIAGAPLLRILLDHSVSNGAYAGYVLMPCRADALGWGIAAALITRTSVVWETILRFRRYLYAAFGGVAVAVVALLLSGLQSFGGEVFGLEYSLLAVFYFLLLMSVLINRKFEAVFSARGLRYMGTIAYGLYLLHYPFIAAGRDIAARIHPGQSGWFSLLVSISAIALATVVAAISWEYLEKPLIKRGHRYGYGKKAKHALGYLQLPRPMKSVASR
jgi:peptidoglycan/LPS O-acetylase OafA/YrhL